MTDFICYPIEAAEEIKRFVEETLEKTDKVAKLPFLGEVLVDFETDEERTLTILKYGHGSSDID